MLQAPVLAFRRGRGVLDGRNPFSVTLPLGRDLWGEADVVLAVGTRMLIQFRQWGINRDAKIIRIDADPKEHNRLHKPTVALTGDSKPILQSLLAELPAHNAKRPSRKAEMEERQAAWRKRFEKIAPQIAFLEAIRDELPEDGIFVEDITQMVFAARIAYPVYKPRTYISPGFQDPLGWGFATRLARSTHVPMCRWWRSAAMAASCSPRPKWRPRCAIAFRSPPSCSTTAPSAMCAASSRSASATG
jgi:acetolactate synthase-1/2/3 large subunit